MCFWLGCVLCFDCCHTGIWPNKFQLLGKNVFPGWLASGFWPLLGVIRCKEEYIGALQTSLCILKKEKRTLILDIFLKMLFFYLLARINHVLIGLRIKGLITDGVLDLTCFTKSQRLSLFSLFLLGSIYEKPDQEQTKYSVFVFL